MKEFVILCLHSRKEMDNKFVDYSSLKEQERRKLTLSLAYKSRSGC